MGSGSLVGIVLLYNPTPLLNLLCLSKVLQFCFNPLALWALPLYRCAAQGERDMHHSVPAIEGIIPSLLAVSRSITGDSALAIKEYVRKGKGAAMYL